MLPGIGLFNMYGLTEVSGRLCVLPPAELDVKVGSVGRPIGDMRVVARRGDLTEAAPGEQGELYVTGSLLMQGYLDEPEITAKTLTGARPQDGRLRQGRRERRRVDRRAQGRHHQARRREGQHHPRAGGAAGARALRRRRRGGCARRDPRPRAGGVRRPARARRLQGVQAAARAARRAAVDVPAQPRHRRRGDPAHRIRKGDQGRAAASCSPRSWGEQLQEGPAQQESSGARRGAGAPRAGASRHSELVHERRLDGHRRGALGAQRHRRLHVRLLDGGAPQEGPAGQAAGGAARRLERPRGPRQRPLAGPPRWRRRAGPTSPRTT